MIWREAVGTCADRWERDGADVLVAGELQRVSVTVLEQLRLILRTVIPNGANCVDDVLGFEIVPFCEASFTCGAAAQSETLLKELGGLQQRELLHLRRCRRLSARWLR